MTLRQRILDIAASQAGVTEDPPGTNQVIYWDWWANGDGVVQASEVLGPWCASFVSWVFDQAGAPLPPIQRDRGGFAGVQAGVQYAVNANELTQDPIPGDIVLFSWLPISWDSGYPWVLWNGAWVTAGDHTGIFSHFDGENYWCWEGNTSVSGSQDNGGAVHLRPRSPAVIIGFWRPAILASEGAPPPIIGDPPARLHPPQPPNDQEDLMLYAYRLPNEQTIRLRNPATGKTYTVEEVTPTEGPAANDAWVTYQELCASGQCKPFMELGWNANWALSVIDGRT